MLPVLQWFYELIFFKDAIIFTLSGSKWFRIPPPPPPLPKFGENPKGYRPFHIWKI